MKELEVFDYGILQDTVNVLSVMEESGITVEQLKTYVSGLRVGMTTRQVIKGQPYRKAVKIKFPKCPKCGSPLRPFKVPENSFGYTYRLVCMKNINADDPNAQCGYEEFRTGKFSDLLGEINA